MTAGRVVETKHLDTLADGVAGGMDLDRVTLPLAISVVDQVIECDEEEIRTALKTLAFDENFILEGSAALALAGYNKATDAVAGQTSILILCGANLNRDFVLKESFGL
jgi:threonine dehydratase